MSGEEREFYVLRPVANPASTIYVPLDNTTLTSRMMGVLTKSEIDKLITTSNAQSLEWVNDRNDRRAFFHSIISKCDRRELMLLVSCIYEKKTELINNGKKLASSDDEALKFAERLIEDEFSFSLGLACSEVGEYIRGRLGVVPG
jgi:RNA polymerase-interacting CarD/CdnL/TRCF family regulator